MKHIIFMSSYQRSQSIKRLIEEKKVFPKGSIKRQKRNHKTKPTL